MADTKKADLGSVIERIGDAIRQRREQLGLDVAQLAREAKVSRTTLHDAEENRVKLRATTARKIMRALEEAEAESGVTRVVPSETPEAVEMIEFEVAGDFGVKVVVRGPISEHETLRADVAEIIRSIRDGGGKSTA